MKKSILALGLLTGIIGSAAYQAERLSLVAVSTDFGCFAKLDLDMDNAVLNGPVAFLRGEPGSSGGEIFDSSERIYRITLRDTSCGSSVYVGKKQTLYGTMQVEITDHRKRICQDMVPKEVLVLETGEFGLRCQYSTKLNSR